MAVCDFIHSPCMQYTTEKLCCCVSILFINFENLADASQVLESSMADPISSFRRSTGIIVEENMKHDVRVKLNFFNVFYFFHFSNKN